MVLVATAQRLLQATATAELLLVEVLRLPQALLLVRWTQGQERVLWHQQQQVKLQG